MKKTQLIDLIQSTVGKSENFIRKINLSLELYL